METPRSPTALFDCRPSITGKVALVTGGLGGNGRACVAALVAHGAKVAFTYAEGQEAPSVAETLVATNPEHLSAHALDLRSAAPIQSCFQQVLARWQTIHILVNTAAVGSATVAAYADSSFAQDSAMLTINADGSLKVCQLFLSAAQETLTTVSRKRPCFKPARSAR